MSRVVWECKGYTPTIRIRRYLNILITKIVHVSQDLFMHHTHHSLVPRPHPAFRRFQYSKAGEGLVSFLT